MTGSADSPGVHYGMLGDADDLVLSPLDDRLFVASSASFSQDPPSAPPAWLIDSVTGQRGALTVGGPTDGDGLCRASVGAVCRPSPTRHPGERFLPRVVDRRDWTIRPLSVPEDATAAVEIHQPGSGRIWIGTAPDGGDSDSHTPTTAGLRGPMSNFPRRCAAPATSCWLLTDDLLVRRGQRGQRRRRRRGVMSGVDQRLFVSADAGETWDVVPVDAEGNGRLLFVMDERLVFAVSSDYVPQRPVRLELRSDWSRLEEIEDLPYPAIRRERSIRLRPTWSRLALQLRADQSVFSTDLSDWWPIPSLPDER